MLIFLGILLFLFLAMFTGHPLSMIIALMVSLIGAGLLAFGKSIRDGFRMKLPGILPSEAPRRYRERMLILHDLKNPYAIRRQNDFRRMSWQQFEIAVQKYFTRLGYATIHTGGSGDQGVDIEAFSAIDQSKAIIQCKHVSSNVGSIEVQKLAGAMVAHQADRAYLVTSADFTEQAREFAAMVPGLTLISGKTLAETWEVVS